MRRLILAAAAVLCGGLLHSARADTHYVAIASTNPVSPFITWETAATNIQDAIDVSVSNDTVLVSNGVYAIGGRVVYGAMTNRVAITNAIKVQSVNGPTLTIIQGRGPPGNSAMRCVYLGTNATLAGFTLTNGASRTSGDTLRERSGGGVLCEVGGMVSNCALTGNSAYYGGGARGGTLRHCTLKGNGTPSETGYGGGALGSTLIGCTLIDNSANYGGGASGCTLKNCVLTGNSAVFYGGGASDTTLNGCTLISNSAYGYGGGTYHGSMNNCIIYYNRALIAPNCYGGTLNYCCTTEYSGGTGNITTEPGLVSATHIAVNSPCVGKGNVAYVSGADVDGEAWCSPPSIGADEPYSDLATGSLSVAIDVACKAVAAGRELLLTARTQGSVTSNSWTFGDGNALANQIYAGHSWAATGEYAVVLTAWNADYPKGVACTTVISVIEHPIVYVNASNATPASPYTNWITAATNIQQAIDANTTIGTIVLVTNGVYETGGVTVYGATMNRVALTNGVTVRSVNGQEVTIIKGKGPSGTAAIRCAYVGTGCVLDGFTLANGSTRSSGDAWKERGGGGVWCEVGGVVSNCTIIGNSAHLYGGGAHGGVLNNCLLTDNSAAQSGGGAYWSVMNNSRLTHNIATYGGGAEWCTLNGCILSSNSANIDGGGGNNSTLNNCVLYGNSALSYGGGSCNSKLNSCTLTGNSSSSSGGGVHNGTLHNSIVFYNTASVNANWSAGTMSYCCTIPAPGGAGNITDDPCLVTLSHISTDSPCVGAGGTNDVYGTDIDGEVWRDSPSIGADEPYSSLATGNISVAIGTTSTNAATGSELAFTALIQGRITRIVWDFGDGSRLTNRPYAGHTWVTTGTYNVVLTAWNLEYPDGVVCTTAITIVTQPYYFVNVANATPAAPYTNWITAATNIQQAIDANTTIGRIVLVADGVYDVGGLVVYGAMTNRVVLTYGVTVRSVNGATATIIKGKGPLGNDAVRCAYVGNSCVLDGFTVIGGATRNSGDGWKEQSGGGVWCEVGGRVSNCVVIDNSAGRNGGGAHGGILNKCALTGNSAIGYGGGIRGGMLDNCILTMNSVRDHDGGGADSSTLNNCTLTKNSSVDVSAGGGGAHDSTLNNCIVYYNLASNSPNYSSCILNYCCTWPSSGIGCVTDAPVFVSLEYADYRLAPLSPCIDRGINQEWMFTATDLDGNPRIMNGNVDMGAYEFHFKVGLQAFLQGPYNVTCHSMSTPLSNDLPRTSPYAICPSLVTQMPPDVTDWVVVQVCPGPTNTPIVAQSAFLRKDGAIISSMGATQLVIGATPGTTNYIRISHRNHLPAMTAQPIKFTNQTVQYSFASGSGQFCGGTNSAVELEPGVWGMPAGDADGDGVVGTPDWLILKTQTP